MKTQPGTAPAAISSPPAPLWAGGMGSAPRRITDALGVAAETGFEVCSVLFGGAPLASAASGAGDLTGVHGWDLGRAAEAVGVPHAAVPGGAAAFCNKGTCQTHAGRGRSCCTWCANPTAREWDCAR